MNNFLQQSIDYANQCNYLDNLFKVYPTIPDGIRDLDNSKWNIVEQAFNSSDNESLINALLKLDLFPIKDSYVAYLKRDKNAIKRNPATINRLAGRLYEMGLSKIFERCSEPKETNRQIGPLFKRWLNSGVLGVRGCLYDEFLSSTDNAILNASDEEMKRFANEYLGYNHSKGLDLVARFNGKYVIGEAKFLTDFGGHQNAQFADAISTIEADVHSNVIKVAVLDGVLYIPGKNKMYKEVTQKYSDYNIMSALLLPTFLYQV